MDWIRSLYLGLVVLTKLLVVKGTTQLEGKTKKDYASVPGHLEPLGAKGIKHPLWVVQKYPDPKLFFKTFVVASKPLLIQNVGGAVASWLVRPTPDRVVRVRGLAGDIVLCSWARHFTLTVPSSTQVYKWVPA